eukprot:12931594-Prorocentrum_lima.AAC.1
MRGGAAGLVGFGGSRARSLSAGVMSRRCKCALASAHGGVGVLVHGVRGGKCERCVGRWDA